MVYFICGSILKSLYKGELEHFSKPEIDVKQHPKIKFDYYATNYRLKPLFWWVLHSGTTFVLVFVVIQTALIWRKIRPIFFEIFLHT